MTDTDPPVGSTRMLAERVLCGCCGDKCQLVFAEHPGYRAGTTYDIHRCDACDTAQASPLKVDVAVYDAIYANIERIPGYDRYVGYEQRLLTVQSPLDHLAECEDIYWAIRELLRARAEARGNLKVLDVGSGLGNLTYALSTAGYDALGIDVSAIAVARAISTFGDLFEQADVVDFVRAQNRRFDVIVMTEVIEHLPQFQTAFEAALELLTPEGELLVTTPNKTSFAADAVWATENPPVHLWWFSESSMRALAARYGAIVEFVDFEEFNRGASTRDRFMEGRRQRQVPFYPPVLGESGEILRQNRARSPREAVRLFLERLRLADPALAARYRWYSSSHGIPPRRPNLCAVFAKQSAADG